jgi:hypothetical protein
MKALCAPMDDNNFSENKLFICPTSAFRGAQKGLNVRLPLSSLARLESGAFYEAI